MFKLHQKNNIEFEIYVGCKRRALPNKIFQWKSKTTRTLQKVCLDGDGQPWECGNKTSIISKAKSNIEFTMYVVVICQ